MDKSPWTTKLSSLIVLTTQPLLALTTKRSKVLLFSSKARLPNLFLLKFYRRMTLRSEMKVSVFSYLTSPPPVPSLARRRSRSFLSSQMLRARRRQRPLLNYFRRLRMKKRLPGDRSLSLPACCIQPRMRTEIFKTSPEWTDSFISAQLDGNFFSLSFLLPTMLMVGLASSFL